MVPAITIAIITAAFLSGIQHRDQCGCHSYKRHHRAESGHCGARGRPSDWPNDGPGFHDQPKNYNNESDEDYYFIGAGE